MAACKGDGLSKGHPERQEGVWQFEDPPAADRAARHREDAPSEAHRGAVAGGRRRGAAGLEDPLRGTELGPQTADHWVHADGRAAVGRRGLRGAGSRRAVPAHGRFPAAARGAGQLRQRAAAQGLTATCCGTWRAAIATSSPTTAARTSASSSSSAGFGLGRGGAVGAARVPAAGGPAPRRVPSALPRSPGSDQRAGEAADDRAPGAGRAHDQRPADDASLARAAGTQLFNLRHLTPTLALGWIGARCWPANGSNLPKAWKKTGSSLFPWTLYQCVGGEVSEPPHFLPRPARSVVRGPGNRPWVPVSVGHPDRPPRRRASP